MRRKRHFLIDMIFVVLGMIILAFAITAILRPSGLVTGGITGISIITDQVLGIDYTLVYYALSILVLLATYFLLGRREAGKIMISSLIFPVVLMLFSRVHFNLTQDDLFLASIYYGVIGGTGVGLILRSGYSTGGTDSIGKIIHKKFYPFVSVSIIMTIIDVIIVLASMVVYDVKIALYALITQVVLLKTVEVVMFGVGTKLMKLEIISECEADIQAYIMNQIKRGTSKYAIIGGYTNQTKSKLVTICTPRESLLIKQFIASVDRRAFVNILPVSSVWGEGIGFQVIDDEE